MHLIRGLEQLQPFKKGCVLTIGNFDGVHLGHRAVVQKLVRQGKSFDLPVVVMVFEPQPLEYFLRDNAPARLTRLQEKVRHFQKLGIDYLVIVRFNQAFADAEPEYFIKEILLNRLNVKFLVIGDDFHFGKARRGNFAMLKEMGRINGFHVESTEPYLLDGHRVSSTLIRDALNAGELDTAEKLLGRAYSVCGTVEHGEKRGSAIGFPTANIQMHREKTPIQGVFAVTMTGVDECALSGVANVGTRPTFDGGTRVILEVHLFNFDEDIYGREVEVHFKKKIRDEVRFNSMDELQRQIHKDVASAQQILAI
jgi:riboflavin kinase/FMN adenylyltransferase